MRKQRIIEMLQESPLDSFLHFALAKEHEKEENWIDAIECYEWIRNHDENYVGLYYHLAAAAIEIEKDPTYITDVFLQGENIALKINDQHALAELKNSKMNWEMGL